MSRHRSRNSAKSGICSRIVSVAARPLGVDTPTCPASPNEWQTVALQTAASAQTRRERQPLLMPSWAYAGFVVVTLTGSPAASLTTLSVNGVVLVLVSEMVVPLLSAMILYLE